MKNLILSLALASFLSSFTYAQKSNPSQRTTLEYAQLYWKGGAGGTRYSWRTPQERKAHMTSAEIHEYFGISEFLEESMPPHDYELISAILATGWNLIASDRAAGYTDKATPGAFWLPNRTYHFTREVLIQTEQGAAANP